MVAMAAREVVRRGLCGKTDGEVTGLRDVEDRISVLSRDSCWRPLPGRFKITGLVTR